MSPTARTSAQTAALEALIAAHATELKLPTVKARFRQMAECWAPFSLVVKWSSRAVLGDRGAAGARRCGDGWLAGVRRISHTSRPLAAV